MCGDFNSSVVFNYHHPKAKNHTELNRKLEAKNLISAYHNLTGDEQGDENEMTFYQARHLNNAFHLDFVYAGKNTVRQFDILDHYKWIGLSDHLPLVFKI
jgi:endonuclease/exonuclease/phosphatase family metal-dependent hydrolase